MLNIALIMEYLSSSKKPSSPTKKGILMGALALGIASQVANCAAMVSNVTKPSVAGETPMNSTTSLLLGVDVAYDQKMKPDVSYRENLLQNTNTVVRTSDPQHTSFHRPDTVREAIAGTVGPISVGTISTLTAIAALALLKKQKKEEEENISNE